MRLGGIRSRLVLMAALPLAAFLVLATFAAITFNQVRVLGENYQQIVQSKDLVADVLPPPQYIIESYLTVLQMTSIENSADRENSIATLQRLEADFRERRLVWDQELTNPTIRQTLLEDAYRPADQFYVLVNEDFIPLVRSGDLEAADNLANGRLRDLYAEHRAAIDRVVLQATAEEERVEDQTAATVESRVRLLVGAFVLLILAIVALAVSVIRSILRPISRLQEVASTDLPDMIQKVRTTSFDDDEKPQIDLIEVRGKSELDQAAAAFNSVLTSAVDLVSQQARLRRNTATTFVNLGRRNQNLVARQLRFIDELEKSETDPELLRNLFRLDHLATRMRRNAESLLVLAGVETPRKWREPVAVVDVVRSALGEVEGYERVRLEIFGQAMLPGTAIADITHLLAELIENALRYSPPDSSVVISGGQLDGDYQLSIVDQGVGLPPRDLMDANRRLTSVAGFDEAPTASLGLFVVARLAARYGITVELESEGGDGLTAYVTVPRALLEQAGDRELQAAGRGRHVARPGGQVAPTRAVSMRAAQVVPHPPAPAEATPLPVPADVEADVPTHVAADVTAADDATSTAAEPVDPIIDSAATEPAATEPIATEPIATDSPPDPTETTTDPTATDPTATDPVDTTTDPTATDPVDTTTDPTAADPAAVPPTAVPALTIPAPEGPTPLVTAAGFKKRQSKLVTAGARAMANGSGQARPGNGRPDSGYVGNGQVSGGHPGNGTGDLQAPDDAASETTARPDRAAEDVRSRYSSFADGKRRASIDSAT